MHLNLPHPCRSICPDRSLVYHQSLSGNPLRQHSARKWYCLRSVAALMSSAPLRTARRWTERDTPSFVYLVYRSP